MGMQHRLTLHASLFPANAEQCASAAALCKEIDASGAATRISHLAVNGRDLAELGFYGRAIGDALQALLDAVIDERTENTRKALLSYAEKHLR